MSWLKDKVKIVLTRKEIFEVANVFADCNFIDLDFLKIRDRKMRKIFAQKMKERHRLWLKIIKIAESTKVKK